MTNDMKNDKGNFAQNPERAREAGRKGGEAAQGHQGSDKSRDTNTRPNQGGSDRT